MSSTRRGWLELWEGLGFEDKALATATFKCQEERASEEEGNCADSKKTGTIATELELGC